MRRKTLIVFAGLAFALVIAGVAFAHMDRSDWCNGDSGGNRMMSSHMGTVTGSPGHMTGSSHGPMTARQERKKRADECPVWNARDAKTGDQGIVREDAGNGN